MKLSAKDCNKVKNLDDLQGKGTTDETGKYKSIDKVKVACLQKYYLDENKEKKEANEMKTMIRNHYKKYSDKEDFYKALCECCQLKVKGFPDIEGDDQWDKFYKCLENKGYKKS